VNPGARACLAATLAIAAPLAGGCAARQASSPAGHSAPATGAQTPAMAGGSVTPVAPTRPLSAEEASLAAIVGARFDAADALALWSVRLERADTHAVLVSRNAGRLVLPASNMKIVTLAAAATRLGWDYRFRTALYAAGTLDRHTLRGDLVVVGGADPTIGRTPDPLSTFRDWARQLRARGIQRVEGDLVGDPSRYGDEWLGDSWSWDDLTFGYATPYSGLIFNENVVRIRVVPASAPGRPAAVTMSPAGSGLDVRADVSTGVEGSPSSVRLARGLASPVLDVTGSIPAGGKPVERTVSVPEPARYFLGALRQALVEEGIEVRGPTRLARTADPELGDVLLVHESPALDEVARRFMKVSQNLYGEVLLRVLAAHERDGTSPADVRAALQETLGALGVPTGAVQGLDGSGLSRRDFVTASAIVTLLRQMAEPPHRDRFIATLPIAATDGTLTNRFKGNACAGRLLAKTGTLSHARALSGYITSASGTPYVFSVIANNFLSPTRDIDGVVEEALGLVCAK
jgi:D-alanyl-D-alanine carboxypeptidase/D-alanyl-D-alanine-endopeptidase (penicillin-binding protein 4)